MAQGVQLGALLLVALVGALIFGCALRPGEASAQTLAQSGFQVLAIIEDPQNPGKYLYQTAYKHNGAQKYLWVAEAQMDKWVKREVLAAQLLNGGTTPGYGPVATEAARARAIVSESRALPLTMRQKIGQAAANLVRDHSLKGAAWKAAGVLTLGVPAFKIGYSIGTEIASLFGIQDMAGEATTGQCTNPTVTLSPVGKGDSIGVYSMNSATGRARAPGAGWAVSVTAATGGGTCTHVRFPEGITHPHSNDIAPLQEGAIEVPFRDADGYGAETVYDTGERIAQPCSSPCLNPIPGPGYAQFLPFKPYPNPDMPIGATVTNPPATTPHSPTQAELDAIRDAQIKPGVTPGSNPALQPSPDTKYGPIGDLIAVDGVEHGEQIGEPTENPEATPAPSPVATAAPPTKTDVSGANHPGPDVPAIDLGPLASAIGCDKFPFGVPCWIGSTVGEWVGSAGAPQIEFPFPFVSPDPVVDLGDFDGPMPFVRAFLLVLATIGLVRLFYGAATGNNLSSGAPD